MTNFGKESSEINIISKDTLKNGDTISITLKDSNGNPIADQKVDIIIENEKKQLMKWAMVCCNLTESVTDNTL